MCLKCVVGTTVSIRLLCFSILPSLFDLSTDILNALDMIFDSTGTIVNCHFEFLATVLNICRDNSTLTSDSLGENNNGNSALQKDALGYISLGIVFLPGIFKALNAFATRLQKREYLKAPLAICYLPFPLYILIIQIRAVTNPLNKDANISLVRVLSMEAFYESFPQLVLQTISLIYSYHLTWIQAASIGFSLLMLAKTVILLDSTQPIMDAEKNDTQELEESRIGEKEKQKNENAIESNEQTTEDMENGEDIQQKSDITKYETRGFFTTALQALLAALRYLIWVLPLYLTSIIYKIAAFSITFAYLRLWGFGTMGLLIIELLVVAKYTGFDNFADRIYPVFSNFFIVNIGGAQIRQKEIMNKDEKKKQEKNYDNWYRFAKRSVILSFLHHSLVLIVIAFLVVQFGKSQELNNQNETKNNGSNNTELEKIFECSGATSCATNVFDSIIYDLRARWFDMQDWLYPHCKDKYCGRTDHDLSEKAKEKLAEAEGLTKFYPFIITICSVILIGLANITLSIYSARDIKAKNTGHLVESGDNEHEKEVDGLNINERTNNFRLYSEKDINGAICTENDQIVLRIKLSNISEYGLLTHDRVSNLVLLIIERPNNYYL